MTTVSIPIIDVRDITPRRYSNGTTYLDASFGMTEEQMFEALLSFVDHVPAKTWARWIERIEETTT